MTITDNTQDVGNETDNKDGATQQTGMANIINLLCSEIDLAFKELPSNAPQKARHRSSSAKNRRPSWTQQKTIPEHVKRMKADLDDLGANFEAVLSDALVCMQTQLSNESDGAEDTKADLVKMAADWKAVNRNHMHIMVTFLERRGVLPFGSVIVPDEPLAVKEDEIG